MYEMAWTSFDCTAKGFKYNPASDRPKLHPTQKPIELYSWIFAKFAEPNMRILDTHLGSGSSRIAAHKAGLDFIGCELDIEYYEAQEKRFKNYAAQLTIFSPL